MATSAVALQESPKRPSLVQAMADERGIDPKNFLAAIKATVFKDGSDEQLMAFLMVASKYNLDPILKEIYAFPSQKGIMPIVSIDGWTTLINRQASFDGVEFVENFHDDGTLGSITAKIFRKDRSHATVVTEYLAECKRNTEPWNKWPIRMLRHKALIQCARVAFSISGVVDEDEADRYQDVVDANVINARLSPETQSATTRTETVKGLVKDQVRGRAKAQATTVDAVSEAKPVESGDPSEIPTSKGEDSVVEESKQSKQETMADW